MLQKLLDLSITKGNVRRFSKVTEITTLQKGYASIFSKVIVDNV